MFYDCKVAGGRSMVIFQKGFNYSQDGPGNRLVYHLKGCNMRCPWCSNPEGMRFDMGKGIDISPEELAAEAVSSKPMFFDDGGVTFTGGEATQQPDELRKVLSILKQEGVNTAIETNGTYKKLNELFGLIDYLIIDFKHPSSIKHKRITGVDNSTIKENIKLAAKSKNDLLIRVPLIGGFNNDNESIEGFLEFFKSLENGNTKIEILKYHEYGKDKWKKCGLEYKIENAFVSEEERIKFENEIKNIGFKIIRT